MARTEEVANGFVVKQAEQNNPYFVPDKSVTTDKLDDGSVTVDKLSDDVKFGLMPVGTVFAVMSNITGAYAPPATGVIADGFMRCDGAAIPGAATLSGNTPDLTSSRFLMGTSGAGAGDNPLSGATGGNVGNEITPTGTNSGGAASFNKNVMNTDQQTHEHFASSMYAKIMGSTTNDEIRMDRINTGIWQSNVWADVTNVTSGHSQNESFGVDVVGDTTSETISWSSSTVNTSFTDPTFTGNTVNILPEYVATVYLIRVQ